MSKFKVGDRVSWIEVASSYHSDGDFRFESTATKYKGTILALNQFVALLQYDRVEFGKHVERLRTLTRLVPKKPPTKAPTREPYRMFVNKYKRPDGSIRMGELTFTSFEQAKDCGSIFPDYIETVEFVEVLK